MYRTVVYKNIVKLENTNFKYSLLLLVISVLLQVVHNKIKNLMNIHWFLLEKTKRILIVSFERDINECSILKGKISGWW